jgi:allantoinase
MQDIDLIIRGRRVVLRDHVGPASIHVQNGQIKTVEEFDAIDADVELIEADDDAVVMPGLVDTHVHINSPGRTWRSHYSH